jgi:hypothetical protein
MNENGLNQAETLLFIKMLIKENERLNSLVEFNDNLLMTHRDIRNKLQRELLEVKARLPKRGRGRPRKVQP